MVVEASRLAQSRYIEWKTGIPLRSMSLGIKRIGLDHQRDEEQESRTMLGVWPPPSICKPG